MSFDARERSAQDGEPVELYTFARDTKTYHYTSADRDITVGEEETYLSVPISRTDIESTNEKARLGIRIRAPRTLEVVELFRVSPPSHVVTCVVQQFHEGDGARVTVWTGRVLSVEFVGLAAELVLEPIFTSVKRLGLRRHVQRLCPHVLYSNACRLNRNDWRLTGTVASIVGTTINSAAAAGPEANRFAGGYLEFVTADGVTERLFILSSTATGELRLASSPYGLGLADTIWLYPGCDHSAATCQSKFNNVANFGGFPYFPKKNPFAGDPIF